MKVFVTAAGSRRADGEEEPIAFEGAGVLTALPNGHRLTYVESGEGVRTTVTCTPGEVTIRRNTAPPTCLRLIEGQRCPCDYQTPYGTFPVVTFGERLRDDLDRGELELSYTLEFGGGTVRTDLRLIIKKELSI